MGLKAGDTVPSLPEVGTIGAAQVVASDGDNLG
jgi:hypothetical protein